VYNSENPQVRLNTQRTDKLPLSKVNKKSAIVAMPPKLMIDSFTELKTKAQAYSTSHRDAPKAKQDQCKEFIKLANRGIREVLLREVDPNGALEHDALREAECNLLATKYPVGKGTSGSSEVQIIRFSGAKQDVAFAFKPIAGETAQNKGDTLRELVSSRMCQAFSERTNIRLDFPDVSAAKVGDRVGALIEGIPGTEIPVEKPEGLSDADKAELDQKAAAVPAKELQKVVLSAVVCGDGDMKWDNVFLVDDGTKARRFDEGKGFPDKDGRTEIFLAENNGQSKILNVDECALFSTPFSKTPLPAADAPMPEEFVAGFLKIKDQLPELAKTMKKEAAAACRSLSTKDKPQQFDPAAIDQTIRSIARAVKILETTNPITIQQFYRDSSAQRVLDMASDFLADQREEIEAFFDFDQAALQEHLAEMNIAGDMRESLVGIGQIIDGGPQNYQDNMADVLHQHFMVIDKLLAALEFASLKPDANFKQELKKVMSVKTAAPKKDSNGNKIVLNEKALGDLVWNAVNNLGNEQLSKLLAKMENLAAPQSGPCNRPGAKFKIDIRHADGDRPIMGIGPGVLFLKIVASTAPTDVSNLLAAAIG
jgi:hypothetical protein